MATDLMVDVDLEFSVDIPGSRTVTGSLTGSGATLELRVSDPVLFAGRADALSLRYLGGGHGEGCNNADDAFTLSRRWLHHFTFYGFLLCFAATSVATLYHYLLDWPAPYPLSSLPVLLGTAGGIGLLVGPAGLFWLNLKRHPQHGDPAQKAMDHGLRQY